MVVVCDIMYAVVKKCAICEKVLDNFTYRFFCYTCYKEWGEQINSEEEWVKFLVLSERKRRRDHKKENTVIRLGDRWDIDENGNLTPRKNNNG